MANGTADWRIVSTGVVLQKSRFNSGLEDWGIVRTAVGLQKSRFNNLL